MALGGTYFLGGLWPPMADAVRFLQQYIEYYNLQVSITSGYRSFEEQAALFAQGRTRSEIINQVRKRGAGGSVTDAPPGQSAHNYGLAVDLDGPHLAYAMDLARQIGFGLVSWDPNHIEWPGWQSLLR